MSSYDFIIAGGGAAGLSLAYEMASSSLRGKNILIIDRDAKLRNDRTWCYWSDKPTRFDHLAYRTWDKVQFISEGFQKVFDLHPYRYRMIRAVDFYEAMRETLSPVPGITFLKARINQVSDTLNHSKAQVKINQDETIQSSWAFDSTFSPSDYYTGSPGYHYLKQHFKGWEIETTSDFFDPSVVTLFDFRTPQKGSMRFFYILPFSRRRALVEYTLFSADLLKGSEYDSAISEYLEKILQVPKYRVEATEAGVIPMTDRPFPRKIGNRVMAIGTKGGKVKPSTGFAFLRIQKDSAEIVQSLLDHAHPFNVPEPPARYHLFDTLMLQVMDRSGDQMAHIFTEMFKNNSIQDIFRFLDEIAPFGENVRFLASLPKRPFINAWFKVKLLRKV